MSFSNEILSYWFGNYQDEILQIEQKSSLWWSKNESTDKEITLKFGRLLNELIAGKLDSWRISPYGRLSMIILADQFSRNIYRDTPAAFAQDNLALGLCREGVKIGIDQQLRAIERVFFYMPLEHSEDVDSQNQSVDLFEKLHLMVPGQLKTRFQRYVDFAHRHRDIIQRFGRFPHRNEILDRMSSAEELEFLKQPGSSF